MPYCSNCGQALPNVAAFCSECGKATAQAYFAPPPPAYPPAQNTGIMDIGDTPQKQLAVIRYVHKKARTLGLVFGILFALMIGGMMIGAAAGSPTLIPHAIGMALLILVAYMAYMRIYVWGYYWLASKFNLRNLVADLVITGTDSAAISYVVGGKKAMRGSLIGTLMVVFLGVAVGCWVGTYLAIKYAILEQKLKKQLKST